MERERANFCEWLQPQPGVWQAGASTAEDARAQLDTLFGEKKDREGVEPTLPESSKADRARAELEGLGRAQGKIVTDVIGTGARNS